MLKMTDFQEKNPFFGQLAAAVEGTVHMLFIFRVPAAVEAEFIKIWSRHGEIMCVWPGYVSELLHKAVTSDNGETMYLNYATWATLAQFVTAFGCSDSQLNLQKFPDEVTLTPEIMKRIAVPGRCSAD